MPTTTSGTSAAAVKAAAPLKKNTVDYIASKLSYDTAIPVAIYDDRTDFIERCKPYDIIDGPNPLDDVEENNESGGGGVVVAGPSTPVDVAKSDKSSSSRSSRKRSRSPLKGTSKTQSVKGESDGESAAAAIPTFTRPSRAGWATSQMKDGRPYQLLRSHDMEFHVRYILDDGDYDWCVAEGLAPEVVQRGITYMEWAYVSSLLTAATPHVDDPLTDATHGAPPSGSGDSTAPGNKESSSSSSTALWSASGSFGETIDGVGGTSAVFSPTSRTIARLGKAKRQHQLEKNAEGNATVPTCALCSKNVQLLDLPTEVEDSSANCGATSTAFNRKTVAKGSFSGASRTGRGKTASPALVSHSRSAHPVPPKLRSAEATIVAGSFPSHDLQHQGLRCCECGVVAHLRCWFLTEPPRQPQSWTCDGCTNYAQHRKRSAGVCCMCGRTGGVLLPYVSSASREDGEGGGPQSPLQLHAPSTTAFGGSPVAQSESVCHAVCALTMSELAIQPRSTVLRRNGLVDMEERPYVYAMRRVGKQRYAMHCVFCQHGGTGRCVQCHHPHCFEAMHASCAAEAHTVDCHSDVAGSPAGFAGHTNMNSGEEQKAASTLEARGGPFSPAVGTTPTWWSSCSTYCKKHYGYSISNSVGSSTLNDKAEADALNLDLTGLLTGADGVTSPVVKKRGRGRPPVAVVQQREAERELIQKLHAYWLARREQRRQASAQLVGEINARLRPVVEATLRPEIVKVSADKVRLSHFLSLVPEWQWQLVSIVEGELPLPDEEYDDVQKYRKVAQTRRSGNTRTLYDRMTVASTQLDLMCRITSHMKQEARLRRISAELEVETLRKLCGWK